MGKEMGKEMKQEMEGGAELEIGLIEEAEAPSLLVQSLSPAL